MLDPNKTKLRVKRYRATNKGKMATARAGKKSNLKRRMAALVVYSSDPPRCACKGCNESHVEFLVIDHINGGGATHRKISGHGSNFYMWLKNNNYPIGFRVLCDNCNMSRGRYGYCPHEKERDASS